MARWFLRRKESDSYEGNTKTIIQIKAFASIDILSYSYSVVTYCYSFTLILVTDE